MGAGVAVVAALTYQPWVGVPFPVTDYGNWLAVLHDTGTAGAAFKELVRQHLAEGRLNPLSMAYIASNWALFGNDVVGWQWFRFALMLAVALVAYALMRRLGVQTIAAACGTALFVIADSARAAWITPQVFEPVAALCILSAGIVATRFQESAHPLRRGFALGALIVMGIWVREPIVACVTFVLLVAFMRQPSGEIAWPRVSRRNLQLLAIVGGLVVVFNALPLFAVRQLVEDSGSYASRYSLDALSFAGIRNVTFATYLPVTRVPAFPANALYGLLVAIAWALAVVSRRSNSPSAPFVLAISLPFFGALIYMPWPAFPGYYAFPFLFGVALLLAISIDRLTTDARRAVRGATFAGVAIIVGYGVLLALNDRAYYRAQRLAEMALMRAVANARAAPRLVVPVRDTLRSGHIADGYRLYASALGWPSPREARDVPCDRVGAELESGAIVLGIPEECEATWQSWPTQAQRVHYEFTARDWKTLRSRRGAVEGRVWAGGGTTSPSS